MEHRCFFLFSFFNFTSRIVSYYLLFGCQLIDLMLALYVILCSVCRLQTLPHVRKIQVQEVKKFCLKSALLSEHHKLLHVQHYVNV